MSAHAAAPRAAPSGGRGPRPARPVLLLSSFLSGSPLGVRSFPAASARLSRLVVPASRRRAVVVLSQLRKPHDRDGPHGGGRHAGGAARGGKHAAGGGPKYAGAIPEGNVQLALSNAASVSAVLSIVTAARGHLLPLNTATAIHRLAKLSRGASPPLSEGPAAAAAPHPPHAHRSPKLPFVSDDRFAYIVARAERQLDEMSARQVATTLWAFGKLQWSPPASFWAKVEAYAGTQLRRFSSRGAQRRWRSLWFRRQDMNLGLSYCPLLHTRLRALRANTLPPPTPADISNTLWCYANLSRAPSAALFAALVAQGWKLLAKTGRDPEPQAESNTLWALAKLSTVDAALRLPKKRLEEFEALSLNGLHLYTSQARWREELLALLCLSFLPLRRLLSGHSAGGDICVRFYFVVGVISSPQELALVIWSFATMGHRPSPEWLRGFFHATQSKAAEHWPQGISMLVWSAACLGVPVPAGWLASLATRAQAVLHSFSAQALSNTAWGLATLASPPPAGPGAPKPPAALLSKIETQSLTRMPSADPVVRKLNTEARVSLALLLLRSPSF